MQQMDITQRARIEAFLLHGRDIDQEINQLLAKIGRLAPDSPEIPPLRRRVIARVQDLRRCRAIIADVIQPIADLEVRLTLSLRCLTGKTWVQIGFALSLDDSAARRRFDKGVAFLAAVYESRPLPELPE